MFDDSFCYEVFGLTVASDIPLPELHRISGREQVDVVVRAGEVRRLGADEIGLSIHGEAALLFIPGVGRYWVRGGKEMIVEREPGVSDRNLRLYLLGSAFAAILHQRSLLPLHANAVVIGGKAVAFMGHSGAGKSTIAAWFHDRGFTVLADDVCVVTEPAGHPIAHPGIPRLRLWREALEASGRRIDSFDTSFDDMDKYDVPTGDGLLEAVPLHHVYILGRADDGDAGIERMRGSAAVEVLVANTYRGAYVPRMGLTGRHLMACAALAAKLPVFRAVRRWGLDRFDEQASLLESHARSLIAQGTGSAVGQGSVSLES